MRYIRSIVVILCTVLCALSLAGWVRSRWVSDEVFYGSKPAAAFGTEATCAHGFAHGGGDIAFLRCESAAPMPIPTGWRYRRLSTGLTRHMMPDRVTGLFGYGVVDSHSALPAVRYVAIVLPYWVVTLLAAFPFLFMAWRHWRARDARRLAAGLCPACGYDLRASENRCPECGAARAAPPAVVAGAA